MNDKDIIISRYREYFLKIIAASGGDVSGVDRPDQIAFPPIEEYALKEVEELKSCYEEVLTSSKLEEILEIVKLHDICDPDEYCSLRDELLDFIEKGKKIT